MIPLRHDDPASLADDASDAGRRSSGRRQAVGASVRSRPWGPAAAAVGVCALLFDDGGLVALPLVIVLAATQMPAATVVRRLALAVLALFGLNAAVLTVLVVLEVAVDARLLIAAYLVAGGFLSLTGAASRKRRRLIDVADRWALGSAVIIFAIFYRPFIGTSLGERLARLSYSTDGGTHLKFVHANLDQAGYLSSSDYPQAWAGNVALAVGLLVGRDPSPMAFIQVVAPLVIALYALLVYFAVALVLETMGSRTMRVHPAAAVLAVACIGLTTLVGSSSLLLQTESYTQVAATLALLAIGSLLVAPSDNSMRLLITLGLLSLAVMQTWYLLAPVLAALVLLYMVAVRPPVRWVLGVGPPFALLAAYPILNGPQAVTQINALGGTAFTSASVTIALLLLTLITVVALVQQKPLGGKPLVVLVLIVSSLLVTTSVVALQVQTGTGFSYYALKLLFVVFLFGVVGAASAVGIQVQHLVSSAAPSLLRRSASAAGVAVVVIGALVWASVGTRHLVMPYARGLMPENIDGRVLDAIFTAHPNGLDPATDAWIVDACSRVDDHIANKWIHDFHLTWNPSREVVNIGYRSGTQGDIGMLRTRAAEKGLQRMELYVGRNCEPTNLARLARVPKVTIVSVP